jgi:hypothetical protein
MISLARYHDLMIFGLRSIFEYDISFEEPKDSLARLISAGVRPLIAVSDKFRPIQKVLIAYSGSMESVKTMKLFVQLRLWPYVKLKIVNFQMSGTWISCRVGLESGVSQGFPFTYGNHVAGGPDCPGQQRPQSAVETAPGRDCYAHYPKCRPAIISVPMTGAIQTEGTYNEKTVINPRRLFTKEQA